MGCEAKVDSAGMAGRSLNCSIELAVYDLCRVCGNDFSFAFSLVFSLELLATVS